MRRLAFGVAASLVLAAAIACSSNDEEQVSGESRLVSTATPSPSPSPPPTPLARGFDDLMVEIEHEVPGFAGMSVDESRNVLLVRLTQPGADLVALEAAIVARFPLLSGKALEVVGVSFDFGDLSSWYWDVQDVIYTDPDVSPFISTTDVDEVRNQIVIGVVSEEARQKAERDIATLGLPAGAVTVEIQPFAIADVGHD